MLLLAAALAGMGLAYVMESDALPHLRSGALVRALEDWCPPFQDTQHPARGSRGMEEPSRDMEEPSRDMEEPSRDMEEPSRDMEEPSRDMEEPSRDIFEVARTQLRRTWGDM